MSNSFFVEGDAIIKELKAIQSPDAPLVIKTTSSQLHLAEHYDDLPYPYSFAVNSIEQYQEQPGILDSHIEAIANCLIEPSRSTVAVLNKAKEGWMQDKSQSELFLLWEKLRCNLRTLYALCKCRGSKIIGLLFFY